MQPLDQIPITDLRLYLAEERTFLAWIRTGIALMGFGVLLARFGIFGDAPHGSPPGPWLEPHRISLWLATALIAIGVAASLSSARRYMRLVSAVNRGTFVHRALSSQGLVVALSLAFVGAAMVVYLISGLA